MTKVLPVSIFNFCRRYLVLSLPTKANLSIWNQIKANVCSLCNEKAETLHHTVANCNTAANQGRYTWRHDSILYTIANHLNQVGNAMIYADIAGFQNPSSLFRSIRPDIVMAVGKTYHVIELTVCFETNLLKSHE